MATLTLSGGYHNAPPVTIRISQSSLRDYLDGRTNLDHILTTEQRTQLQAHFCGLPGCTCDAYRSATVTTDTAPDPRTVGAQIAELRRIRGLSQRQLADRTGIDHSHIVRIEHGRRSPTADTLQRLADALGSPLIILPGVP